MRSDGNCDNNGVKLSKLLAYALRHKPSKFGLNLDEDGFTDIDRLVQSINNQNKNMVISKENIMYLVSNQQKARLEIKGTRIRALYGHTVRIRKKTPVEPPGVLYHGTSRYNYDAIIIKGLRKMKRQYVHLSSDVDTAIEVGKRRDESPIVFSVNSKEAYLNGVLFYVGSQTVWLSENIDQCI